FGGLPWVPVPCPLRVTLANEFAFRGFWAFPAGLSPASQWKESVNKADGPAFGPLSTKETSVVLAIVFSRLYVLRNQLIHGGATYGSSVNRQQLKDATAILRHVVPYIIKLMMDNPNELWGEAAYPVVER